MLSAVFLEIVNMSLRAGLVALAVMALRLLFRKAPKWMLCLLWAMVAFRLIFPVSVESEFSGMGVRGGGTNVIRNSVLTYGGSGAQPLGDMMGTRGEINLNPNSADTVQVRMFAGACLWLAGMGGMLAYALIGWAVLKFRLSDAVRLRENVYQSERAASPFVMGVFRPRIYIPYKMDERDREQVILHERAHLQRGDHLWKLLAFLLLSVYWFHPLMWISYVLFCRDMERACDEKVISPMSDDERRTYASALLNCASGRHIHAVSPLAFGEVGVKARILGVMKYKKSAVWLTVLVMAAAIGAAVCLLTDPVSVEMVGNTPLHYQNAGYAAGEMESVTVIYCPAAPKDGEGDIQIGSVTGDEVKTYLLRSDWRQAKGPFRMASPGSIEFVFENEYRLTVYDENVAKIEYKGEECWYRIRVGDYMYAQKMALSPAATMHALIDETDDERNLLKGEVSSEAGTVFIELGAYGEEFEPAWLDVDSGSLLRVPSGERGTIRLAPGWETEELIVREDYYRHGTNSLVIESQTHHLTQKDEGGAYVLSFENRGNLRDHIAYVVEGEAGTYAFKVTFQGVAAVSE